MLLRFLGKELQVFFKNKTNWAFMMVMPVVIVAILGFGLERYMDADYNTFEDAVVFYVEDGAGEDVIQRFDEAAAAIRATTGADFIRQDDYQEAVGRVERSEGVAVITLSAAGITYYRSPYNETNGGAIIRSLTEQLAVGSGAATDQVQTVRLDVTPVSAKAYYSFAGLAFVILYMALLISNSAADEKEYGTLIRIQISRAGTRGMFISKILTGMVAGIVIMLIVYVFSYLALDVSWGELTWLMMGLFLLLAVFSAVAGCVLGLLCKTRSLCQNIVLVANVCFGFLGGAFLPLTMLERMPVLRLIARVSPLYWLNSAMAALYNGTIDHNTYYSAAVLTGLSVLSLLIYAVFTGAAGSSSAGREVRHA